MPKNTKDSSSKKNINKDTEISKIDSTKSAKSLTSTTKKGKTKSVKSEQKKSTSSSNTKKKSAVQKSNSKKNTSKPKKKTTTKKSNVSKQKKVEVIEYYDLPYRYNQTIVKILAQTPNTLFVYWDISDEDRKNYINTFGNNFFDETVPVLIVHNKTMNYTFEIEINDFANSWYFNVQNSKCDYEIELGRRPKTNEIELPDNYVHITSSNVIEAPNNHILFEKNQKLLFFRNVKTNSTVEKDVSNFSFMNYAGRIYNIYEMYKKIYKKDELANLEKLSSSK